MAAPLTQRDNTGVVTGVVTRVDAQGRPYVEVPRVAPGFEFGPVLSSAGALSAGDRVVVGFLEGLPDTPVAVARVGGPTSTDIELDDATMAEIVDEVLLDLEPSVDLVVKFDNVLAGGTP